MKDRQVFPFDRQINKDHFFLGKALKSSQTQVYLNLCIGIEIQTIKLAGMSSNFNCLTSDDQIPLEMSCKILERFLLRILQESLHDF